MGSLRIQKNSTHKITMSKTYYSTTGTLPDFPGYCYRNFFQVPPAEYISRIRDEVHLICPPADLAKLRELATLEDALAAAAEKFGEPEARAEHEAATADLRSNPTAGNVEKLKKLGSLDVILNHYGIERRKLEAAALDVRRNALPIIDSSTRRLVARLVDLAEVAREDEVRLFEAWGIPAPEISGILPHIHRTIQEIAENLRRESVSEHPFGVGTRGFLRMLGIE
jgi:hypothetical protein